MRSTPEPPPDVTPEHRALTRRAADLCRADPAAYAAIVRHADQLRAAGIDHVEALEQALIAAANVEQP